MITQKWVYKRKPVISKWIPSNNYGKFDKINQVYGICFDNQGKILIVKDSDDWKLPGGTPENNETPEETLKREVFEEATVLLDKCFMLGCQESKLSGKIIHQLRYASLIKEVKKHTPDPATEMFMQRKFIEQKEFENYVNWGNIGKEMFRLACEWYSKL